MVSQAVHHESIAWNTSSGIDATSRGLSNDGTNANGSYAIPTRNDPQSVQDPPRRISTGNDGAKSDDEHADSDTGGEEKGGRCWTKFIIVLLILGVVTATVVDLACHDNVRSWLEDCFQWIEDHPKGGVVVFALIFFAATLLFVPGIILTIGAGVAFGRALGFALGLLLGTVAVLIGAYAACIVAFYLGRYVMHDQAQRLASRYRILGAINKAIEHNGIKIMFLLRLSPLVPFSGFNFIAGLTKVTLRDYAIGCFGVLPGTIAFVFIGASTAGSMNEGDRMDDEGVDRTECIIRMVVFIAGSCAAVVAMVVVTIYARRALKEALEVAEQEDKDETASELARKAWRESATDVELSSSEEFKEDMSSTGSEISP